MPVAAHQSSVDVDMNEHTARRSLVRSLFPSEVVVEEASIRAISESLFPEERACVEHAIPKRVREFTAGRVCARRALAELGITDYPLLVGRDRAPIWPPEVIGSISHTSDFCAVAVARRSPSVGIGLDIEPAGDLADELWPHVLTQLEQRWLEGLPAARRGGLAKLVFCAKECTYKCHYGVHQTWLDFSDADITIDLKRGEFAARINKTLGPRCSAGTRLVGRFVLDRQYICAGSLFTFGED